jgi:hypothetical protein
MIISTNKEGPMNKILCVILAIGLLAGGAFGQSKEKKVEFSLNMGVMTNLSKYSSFDEAQGTLDLRAGIKLGKSFQISPEIMYATFYRMHFDYAYLYPGVVVNYVAKDFFLGAGVVVPILFGQGESNSGNPAPKINIGYTKGHLLLTVYMITWTERYMDFLDFNFVGATFGYRF